MKLPVLDKGFVELKDFFGGDNAAVQAARVSYGQELKGEEKDKKLINFLVQHNHMTPFEHSVFKFHIKCPIFVARQWMRHRTGSFNEISYRYTEVKEEFYIPEKWRGQDTKNKQGSTSLDSDRHLELNELLSNHNERSLNLYHILLASGVAREMARMVLPVNIYTEFYWTVNARNLIHFIELRTDNAAQYEIRQYGIVLELIAKEKMPWTLEAFANKSK